MSSETKEESSPSVRLLETLSKQIVGGRDEEHP